MLRSATVSRWLGWEPRISTPEGRPDRKPLTAADVGELLRGLSAQGSAEVLIEHRGSNPLQGEPASTRDQTVGDSPTHEVKDQHRHEPHIQRPS